VSRPAVVAVLLVFAGCTLPSEDAARAARIKALKESQARLWKQFEDRIAPDPVVQGVLNEEAEVLIVIEAPLLRALIQQVAARYLDRVELNLPLGAKVDAKGEVRVKGKLGIKEIHAGTWTLHLVVHRIRGVLAAREPVVTVEDERRIGLRLPVALQGASGTATLRFEWDSRGLANAVCRDFRIERRLEATAEPTLETFSGSLAVETQGPSLHARPSFKDVPYTVRPVPTPESWKTIEAALAEQDSFTKCGIALDPEAMLPRLRERLAAGFPIHLPRKLFRAFDLPASLSTSIEHEGRSLALAVSPAALRFAHGALWYGSRVDVGKGAVATAPAAR
jgi:hypothetical protein